MRNNFTKKKLYVGGALVLFLAVFGYAVSFLMVRIEFLKEEYLSKQSGLVALEQKQKQAALLSEQLAQIKEEKQEILAALMSQRYEDKLRLIVALEDAAKSLGLVYELRVVKELTQEEIDRERELILRSRRGSKQPSEEKEEEKLPGITFEVNLKGSYAGLVSFLQKLQSLPYYSKIERLHILREAEQEGGGTAELDGEILVTFFSKA